jgi:DNA-binding protein HU-beta
MTMKKSELVDQVAKGAGVAKRQAEKVLDAFFDTAKKAAKKGDEVSWPKFGVVEAAVKAGKKAGKQAGKTASSKKGAAKKAVTKVVETVEKVVHIPGSKTDDADGTADEASSADAARPLEIVREEPGTPVGETIPAPAVPGTAASPVKKAPAARKAPVKKVATQTAAVAKKVGARTAAAAKKAPAPARKAPAKKVATPPLRDPAPPVAAPTPPGADPTPPWPSPRRPWPTPPTRPWPIPARRTPPLPPGALRPTKGLVPARSRLESARTHRFGGVFAHSTGDPPEGNPPCRVFPPAVTGSVGYSLVMSLKRSP